MIRIHVDDDEISRRKIFDVLGMPDRLTRIEHLITKILEKEKQQMARTSELLAAVTEQTTVIAGVGTFIEQLKAALLEQGIEQADIDAALQGVTANSATAALFVNTPTPPPVEV